MVDLVGKPGWLTLPQPHSPHYERHVGDPLGHFPDQVAGPRDSC